MEDLMGALKDLNVAVSNFPIGAETTQSVNSEDFDKLEKAFNAKKGELYLNAAYKDDLLDDNATSSSSVAMQDYLKEKYMKECRDLSLRGVMEMLSLENVFRNANSDGERKCAEIKRRLMKLSHVIMEMSEEEEIDNQKLYEEMVSKEMKLLDLLYKYQDVASKVKEKRGESPDALAKDERFEKNTRSLLDKINFMKSLTVNLIGSSRVKLSENPDIVQIMVERCQPILYENIENL